MSGRTIFGLALLVLAVAGCVGSSESVPTEPSQSKLLPRLAQGVEVSAVVSLRLTTYDRAGKMKHRVDFPKRRVRGIVAAGMAMGRAEGRDSYSIGVRPTEARMSRNGAGAISPPSFPRKSYDENGEPILIAVLDGELTTAFTQTFFDSAGVSWMQQTSGSGNGPIRTSDLYQNGVVRSMTGYEWTQTSGGHFLTGQVAHLYDEQGYLVAQVVEQTDPSGFAIHDRTIWSRARAQLASVGKDIICALGPKTAFAQSGSCFAESLIIASHTVGIIAHSALLVNPVTGTVGLAAGSAYIANWGMWTGNLIKATSCWDRKLGGGGGGNADSTGKTQNPT